jgi:nucleotide-binding universal stress UspA family protein
MRSGDTVLCAVDRDDRAADLVVAARRLSCVAGMRPVFVHVDASADSDVAELVEMGVAPDELPVRSGDPECEVLRLVRDERPAIAVVGGGHRGSVAEALLGGVCASLAHDPSCPVMVVAPGMDVSFDGGPVVCGLRLDHTAGGPARWAGQLAALADRWLILANMVSATQLAALGAPHAPVAAATAGLVEAEERTAFERLRDTLADLRLPSAARGDVAVRIAPAVDGLAELADDVDADAIVVGAHRRGPVRKIVLGSIWRELWQRAPCPVIVVADD